MNNRHFHVYAPLQDFQWDGSDFELAPSIWIRRFDKPPNLLGMHEWLSKEEWDRASGATHWLMHEARAGAVPSAGEVENLFLLSLWLVKPHRAQIAFRFKIGREEADGEKSRQRLLDRFMWVPGSIHLDFDTHDLQSAAQFYGTISALCSTRLRLNDALLLTLSGCWSHAWQVSLICHAAAAEAILTYSTGPGITRRLATAFACLTETQPSNRDTAFREFTSLYSNRSNIMHGRTHSIASADRLPTLVRFQALLRKLWCTVCLSPSLVAVLEGSDAQREAHFKALQQGYTPPP